MADNQFIDAASQLSLSQLYKHCAYVFIGEYKIYKT